METWPTTQCYKRKTTWKEKIESDIQRMLEKHKWDSGKIFSLSVKLHRRKEETCEPQKEIKLALKNWSGCA